MIDLSALSDQVDIDLIWLIREGVAVHCSSGPGQTVPNFKTIPGRADNIRRVFQKSRTSCKNVYYDAYLVSSQLKFSDFFHLFYKLF